MYHMDCPFNVNKFSYLEQLSWHFKNEFSLVISEKWFGEHEQKFQHLAYRTHNAYRLCHRHIAVVFSGWEGLPKRKL